MLHLLQWFRWNTFKQDLMASDQQSNEIEVINNRIKIIGY